MIKAHSYTESANVSLILNSSFNILSTFNHKQLEAPKYFTKKELDLLYTPEKRYNTQQNFKPDNVIIIILKVFAGNILDIIMTMMAILLL